MEGWKAGRARTVFVPLGLVVFLFAAQQVRADLLCVENSPAGYRSSDNCRPEKTSAQINGKSIVQGLRHEWQNMREDLTRNILEATLTMFFIKTTPPPSGKPPVPKTTPPPQDNANNPPPPPPPPPPPDGQGEVPPINPPPTDQPPSTTPEPTGLVLAMFGACFVSFCGWRRRRAKHDE